MTNPPKLVGVTNFEMATPPTQLQLGGVERGQSGAVNQHAPPWVLHTFLPSSTCDLGTKGVPIIWLGNPENSGTSTSEQDAGKRHARDHKITGQDACILQHDGEGIRQVETHDRPFTTHHLHGSFQIQNEDGSDSSGLYSESRHYILDRSEGYRLPDPGTPGNEFIPAIDSEWKDSPVQGCVGFGFSIASQVLTRVFPLVSEVGSSERHPFTSVFGWLAVCCRFYPNC